jgi:hypothetical protein
LVAIEIQINGRAKARKLILKSKIVCLSPTLKKKNDFFFANNSLYRRGEDRRNRDRVKRPNGGIESETRNLFLKRVA